jgi:hypothetical protein
VRQDAGARSAGSSRRCVAPYCTPVYPDAHNVVCALVILCCAVGSTALVHPVAPCATFQGACKFGNKCRYSHGSPEFAQDGASVLPLASTAAEKEPTRLDVGAPQPAVEPDGGLAVGREG